MKKKWDLGKEMLQCLALAHFAVHTYKSSNASDHSQKFYDLFDPIGQRNLTAEFRPYKRYLGSKFLFAEVIGNWETSFTASTGVKSVEPAVKIVYDMAKTFYEKNLISKNFKQYQFLDQSDIFMKVIKDRCLQKIVKAIQIPIKIDILSSSDIYIVKTVAKGHIGKRFKNEILKKSDIQINVHLDAYNKLLEEYWLKNELFGVSLKLPETIGGKKNIKVVGKPSNKLNKKMMQAIDPYSKFILLLSDPKTNIDKLIEETVFISPNIDVNRVNTWKFPVVFRYKRLNLYDRDVKFNLLAWQKGASQGGGSAGFNGKFVNTPGYGSQWVGGSGIRSLEFFLFKYPEFNKINAELNNIRKKALNYALTGNVNMTPNLNAQINAEIVVNKPYGAGKTPFYRKLKTKEVENTYTKETGRFSSMRYLKGKHGKYDYGANPDKNKKTYTMEVRNLQTLYESAKREITSSKFLAGVERHEKLEKFISEYEKLTGTTDVLKTYENAVVNLTLRKQPLNYNIDRSPEVIKTHYEHSQITYFLTRGGIKMRSYLKKRIFLTVFGVITKKSYKLFMERNPTGMLKSTQMVSAITSQIRKLMKEKIKIVKEFDTAYHFYAS